MNNQNKVKNLDPKNDVVFQKIFGHKDNKDILISFLKAILGETDEDIESVEFEEKKLSSEMILDEKIGILDIRVTTDKGTQINIEIQLLNQYNMIKRTLFYWSKLYSSKIKSGSKYSSLTKTITINILNFNYLEFENYHTINSICEEKSKKRLTDILQIHFIELPKFIKGNKNLQDPLERWLTFLVNPEDDALEEIEMVEDKIKKAHETLEYLSQDEETVILARLREKAIMDEASRLEGAREEGIKEGIKEGKSEILIKLLTKKFGNITDENEKKIKNLSDRVIDIILVDIFELESLNELEKYF